MRFVSAAPAVCAVAALAAPAFAQARSVTANNFRVQADGTALKNVRSVEFEAQQTAAAFGDRAGPRITPGPVQLKVSATRSETYFDDWMADTKSATRKVRVELLDAAGKPVAAYDFMDCWIAKSVWSLDAASNAVATATWTLSCANVARGAP